MASNSGKEGAMTEKQRLIQALFGNEDVTQRNIKFMRGDRPDVSEDDFCRQINSALVQKRSGLAKRLDGLPETPEKFKASDIVGAL